MVLLMPRRVPPAVAAPAPSSPGAARLIAQRHRALARARRARLGFWRSFGRSNRWFPRKLIVTRDGKWIIGLTLLLGAGAVNTGNNLLYLILSLCISVISVSGILSELNLKNLLVTRHYPPEITVGEAAQLRLEIFNDKARSALHIEVGELIDEGDVETRPGYALQLAAREVGQAFAQLRPLRRGPIATVGLQVATGYPFGFARKIRLYDAPAHLLSLPNVARVDLPRLGAAARGALDLGHRAGQGDAFRALRDARLGDSMRDIHWKVSARRERLIAREWEAEASRVCMVRFAHVAPEAGSTVQDLDAPCATVAGLCAALLDAGLSVGLETLQGQVMPSQETVGKAEQLLRIRRHLAHLTLADRRPPPSWPLPDAQWAALAQQADVQAAALAQLQPLAWPPRSYRGAAQVFFVAFTTRPDARDPIDSGVTVLLGPDGSIASIARADARTQGAA